MASRGWERVTPQDVTRRALKQAKPPKRSKYNAKRTVVDGITFDSAKEAKRFGELKLLEKAGDIRGLILQPSYPLDAFGVESRPIGIYRADFEYEESDRGYGGVTWTRVVEDVKGMPTLPLARWKQKHLKAQYGITVREIR